jgi:hypothetical protein
VAGGREFDRAKFKELVLYFSQESLRAGDEGFGMVKLNKLLYRADFEAFRLLGRSITGETYEKQEFGPVARDLPIVLDELGDRGYLVWQNIASGPYTRKVPEAREEPDLTLFPDDELAVIRKALNDLAVYGGRSASEWSHMESAGWNVAREYGDRIAYETTFISTAPIPEEDLERARQFVRDRGWVKRSA